MSESKRVVVPPVDLGMEMPASKYDPTVRPQGAATGYYVPGRGETAQPFDFDNKWDSFSPSQSGETPEHEQYRPGSTVEVGRIDPVAVAVVSVPMTQHVKGFRTRIAIDGQVNYPNPAAPFLPNPNLAVMVAPRDPARVAVTFSLVNNVLVAGANIQLGYLFAISHDGAFSGNEYVIVNTSTPLRIETTEPVFATIVAIANYDATKQNQYLLNMVTETAALIESNPEQPVVYDATQLRQVSP